MKRNEVQIGGVYLAKVTNKTVRVRIDAENPHGGWDATNLETNKKVRIKTAARLRGEVSDAARADRLRGIAAADQQNARLRDERTAAPDGMATSERAMAPSEKPRKKGPVEAAEAKRVSCIDAAARVLQESGEPMNAKQMIDAITTKGYWTSPAGKTPHQTLYSAILREITVKGGDARFRKVERGRFSAANG